MRDSKDYRDQAGWRMSPRYILKGLGLLRMHGFLHFKISSTRNRNVTLALKCMAN